VHPSLEQLHKIAKELLRSHRAGNNAALERFRAVALAPKDSPPIEQPTLAGAQFVIAREYGFENWAKLKHHVESLPVPRIEEYERLAKDLAAAHMSANPKAVRAINRHYGTAFAADFHDSLTMHQRLTTWFASNSRSENLALADARQMVAHAYGFQSWASFADSASPTPPDPRRAPFFISSSPPFYQIDWTENRLISRGPQSHKEWESIFAVIKEHGVTALDVRGITDAAAKQLSRLDQVTRLSLTSDALTDEGLQSLARMPQLLELEISGRQITDGGLAAIPHLARLRRFQSCWTQAISDVGAANLAFCDRLESVDLTGTATGDGLIRALAGKPHLRRLKTGLNVTDAGIRLLHDLRVFKTWLGGEIRYSLMDAEAQPSHLQIDGPFTDHGLASLVGLDGLFGLSFFLHSPAFTSSGLAPLRQLPNLGFLGVPGTLCDDEAFHQLAEMPRLRMLMGQGAVAADEGWEALSRSQTLEYIWGRECPNLAGRGFVALAAMPALRGVGVSCRNVDDASLSALPSFPALRHIMPMDVPDAGFRHVGRCEKLESLWCMYCRDTGDAATEEIASLPRLKTYYAGMTRITDRSLEILSRMHSLERLEFWGCQHITDIGIAQLADLPHLQEMTIEALPQVSRNVLSHFPANVRVKSAAAQNEAD
jgi:hypothetical protein